MLSYENKPLHFTMKHSKNRTQIRNRLVDVKIQFFTLTKIRKLVIGLALQPKWHVLLPHNALNGLCNVLEV